MSETVKNSRSGVLITDEYVDVMRDNLSAEEIGHIVRALFDEIRGEEADTSTFSASTKMIYPLLIASVKRLRKQSDDKARAGATPKKVSDNANSDSISDSNSDSISDEIPSNQPTKPTNETDQRNQPTDRPKEGVFRDEFVVDAWREFVEMRKRIKKPLTGNAACRISAKLEKMSGGNSVKAERILLQSVDNCWPDIYQLREEKQPGGNNQFSGLQIDDLRTL